LLLRSANLDLGLEESVQRLILRRACRSGQWFSSNAQWWKVTGGNKLRLCETKQLRFFWRRRWICAETSCSRDIT